MSKKGLSRDLVFYIVMAASALILFLLVSTIRKGAEDSFRDKGCYSSIVVKTMTSFEYGPGDFENKMNEFCPFYEVIFYDENYEIKKSGEKFQDYKYKKLPYKELNNDAVNDIIAKEVMSCWQKFGGGTLDTFFVPRSWWEKATGWMRDEKEVIGCRTCAEISFELTEPQTFSGFNEYIKQAKLASNIRKESSTGNYYYDYIAGNERFCSDEFAFEDENCWESFANSNAIKINTDPVFDSEETYFVVFVRKDIRKQQGTLNVYVMDFETKNRVCEKPMPFR